MYRTDKQFMTNPATASSRVYIGALAKTIVASDLEEKFKVHGRILGLVLQMGFAFIQFENESQAQAAIKHENNTMLHGRKICVRQALDKSQKGNQNNQNRRQNQGPNIQNQGHGQNQSHGPTQGHGQNQGHGPGQGHGQNQGHGPAQGQGLGPGQNQGQNQSQNQSGHAPPPPQAHNNHANNTNAAHNNESPMKQQFSQPAEDFQKSKPELEKENQPEQVPPLAPQNQAPKKTPSLVDEPLQNEGPPEKRPRRRRPRSKDRFPKLVDKFRDDSYYARDDYPPPTNFPNRPPVIDQPDRNDCEIIVVSKLLTKYAEYIEQRLKALGLIVDLLFPNEDVPIGRVLANISSRGCLYAILVMPQNEEHRSLTLNVLHGNPQEHRNMPIEDALILITRNFDAYMRGDKTTVDTASPTGVLGVSDRHPTAMQLLLNLLAENRQITSVQYDRLLKYLQERREIQNQHEIEEGVDQTSQESNSKQAELQSRIMNILNKTDNQPPPPPPEPQQSTEVAPPLLKDPSVQKALDSLLGGEMFKNISVAL